MKKGGIFIWRVKEIKGKEERRKKRVELMPWDFVFLKIFQGLVGGQWSSGGRTGNGELGESWWNSQ